MKIVSCVAFACGLAVLLLTSVAMADPSGVTAYKKHEFVEQNGVWRATCDTAPDVNELFCRIMTTDKYMAGKNPSFVHFGIAWAPKTMGFVVASYMGFKKESKVVVGVDKHTRFTFPSSQTNTITLGPVVAKPLLDQLLSGNKIVLYFYPKTGQRHLSLVDVKGFKALHDKVINLMKAKADPANAKPQK